jgi:hypothetical protein
VAYFVTEQHIIVEQEGQSILKEENRRPEAGHKPVEDFCIASCRRVTMPLVQRQSKNARPKPSVLIPKT